MHASRKADSGASSWTAVPTLAASILVGLVLLVAAFLQATDSDLYYRSSQEDGLLEWLTVWSFLIAAVFFLLAGRRQRIAGRGFPWFFWGLAAFCVFVAMEEISWGQRLLGYRPPEYFLRENFQQELNIHNVVSTKLRKLVLKAVILGYGVVLPLLAQPRWIRRGLTRLGVIAPPSLLIPAFLATFLLYQIYPWSHSGEWVELMLGLGFLGAAVANRHELDSGVGGRRQHLQAILVGLVLTAVLGFASTALSHLRPADTPAMVGAARTEIEALAADFTNRGRPISRCGIHKRVFSFVEKYDRTQLLEGDFSRLVAKGLPEERAEYFLDPWNSPIWIRHKCRNRNRRQMVFVYSFGPDRRRDSSDWEIRGDDIGVVIFERGS